MQKTVRRTMQKTAQKTAQKKALIVDDSRLAQFVLKKMLLAQNIEVDTSESAEDALGYLTRQKPDMIFLDHSMPGMNGLEALKVIKGNPNTAAIPVMMYTSQEDKNYMSQAQELGAVDVLPKQLTASELKLVLNRLEEQTPTPATINADQEAANERDALEAKNSEAELKQLVRAAEVALEKETNQQQMKLRLEKLHNELEQTLPALQEKLDRVLPVAEYRNNKRFFWNNLLWSTIYALTVLFFGAAYFQQQTTIKHLASKQLAGNQLNNAAQTSSTSKNQTSRINPAPSPSAALASPVDTQNVNTPDTPSPTADLNLNNALNIATLQEQANSNNQIPYGELLLGESALGTLSDLIPALQTSGFTGQVILSAHDGTFCVNTATNGEFELATDTLPASQCQLSESSERLADIASIDLLQFITASNKSFASDFVISINPLGVRQPLESYPEVNDDVTAGNWNNIALRNRRIEFELVTTEP